VARDGLTFTILNTASLTYCAAQQATHVAIVNASEIFSQSPFPNRIDIARIRAPSTCVAATLATRTVRDKKHQKFSAKGVDGFENGCIVRGSLERNARGRKTAKSSCMNDL
jgi:hypothetical protein